MLVLANKKAERLGELKNSITKGAGNIAGYLGELAAQQTIGGKIVDTRDFDIVTDDGIKWDVKTKRTTVKPKDNYECSVSQYNTRQECDKYLFVRVMTDYSKAWIIGWLTKDDFFKKANFVPKGTYDPSNKWKAKAACYSVIFTDLNEIKE